MSRGLPNGVASGTALTRFAATWGGTPVGASAHFEAVRPTGRARDGSASPVDPRMTARGLTQATSTEAERVAAIAADAQGHAMCPFDLDVEPADLAGGHDSPANGWKAAPREKEIAL